MSPDLTTRLAGLTLANPVLTASGCAGTGRELQPYTPVESLGGFVTRTLTLDPRPGWAPPRILETPSGVLHANGLHNPGLQAFLSGELPWLAQQGARVVASAWATGLGEYAELARRLATSPGIAAIEVNLFGTGEDIGRRAPGVDPYQAGKVVSAVRREVPDSVPVLAKLVHDAALVDVAGACVAAGASALVLVQGLPGLALDPVTLRPALGGTVGMLSGAALRALAVRCVWEVRLALPDVPLVGVGGIRTGPDVLEMLAVGACAVQVGTALLADPSAITRILTELGTALGNAGLDSASGAVGRAHLSPDHPPDHPPDHRPSYQGESR